MHRVRRPNGLFALIVLLLSAFISPAVHGQASLNGHTVKLDATGKLLAWPAVQGDSYQSGDWARH